MDTNIQVAIRVRPIIERERKSGLKSLWKTESNRIFDQKNSFTFDRVFGQNVITSSIYDSVAKPIIDKAMEGFNGTIFAYGQTASGKTHTIMGDENEPGILPLAIKDVFYHTVMEPNREFLLRVSYMEIYNEEITDLIKDQGSIKIRNNIDNEIFIENLAEVAVVSYDEAMEIVRRGLRNRKIGTTNMNERSSRSHVIFRLVIESRQMSDDASDLSSQFDGAVTVSQLNLVDLAGSERVGQTGAQGMRLKESTFINQSLLTLGNVIRKLSETEEGHIPYRDSKLTRILQNSLGGNASTSIICAVSPVVQEETEQTLKFAGRAKRVKNRPKKNEVLDGDTMLRRQMKEISDLRKKLKEFESGTVHTDLLIEKDKMEQNFQQKIEQLEGKIAKLNEQIVCVGRTQPKQTKMKDRRLTWCPGQAPPAFEPINLKTNVELSKSCVTLRPMKKLAAQDLVTKRLNIETVNEAEETGEVSKGDMSFEKLEYMLLKEEYDEFKAKSTKDMESLKESYDKHIEELTKQLNEVKDVKMEVLEEGVAEAKVDSNDEIGELKEALSSWQARYEALEASTKDMISVDYLQTLQEQVEQKGKELEAANELTKHENELLKNELDSQKTRWQNQVQHLDEEKSTLEMELTELRNSKSDSEFEKKIEELKTEISMYEESLALKDDYVKTLQEQLKSQNNEHNKVSSLNNQIKQLENSVADALTTVTEKEEKLLELQAELKDQSAVLDLEKQTSEYNEKLLESLKEELAAYKSDNDELKMKIDKQGNIENEIEQYINQMKELEDKILDMQRENDIIVKEKLTLAEDLEKISSESMSKINEIEQLNNDLQAATKSNESITNINDQNMKLEQELIALRDENVKLKENSDDIESTKSALEKLSVELSVKDEALTQQKEALNDIKSKNEKQQIEFDNALKELTEKQNEISRLLDVKANSENELLTLKEQCDIMTNEWLDKEKTLMESNNKLLQKFNSLEEEVEKNNNLKSEYDIVKVSNEQLNNEIESLKEKLSTMETQSINKNKEDEEISRIFKEKEDLEIQVNELNSKIDIMTSEWHEKELELTEANNQLLESINNLKVQVEYNSDLSAQIQSINKEKEDLKVEISQLKENKSASLDENSKFDELMKQFETCKKEFDELQENYQAVSSDLTNKEVQLKNSNEQLLKAIESLNEHKEQSKHLQNVNNDVQEKNYYLSNELEVLKERLNEFSTEKIENIDNDNEANMDIKDESMKLEESKDDGLETKLQESLNQLNIINNEKQVEIDNLTSQLEVKSSQYLLLESNLEKEKDNFSNLQNKYFESEKGFLEKIEKLESDLADAALVVQQNEKNVSLIKSFQDQLLDKQSDDTIPNSQELRDLIDQQKQHISHLENEKSQLDAKVKENSDLLENLKVERADLANELEVLEKERNDLENELIQLKASVESEKDVINSQKANDEETIANQLHEIESLRNKLDIAATQEEEYKKIKANLESDIETLKDCMESQQMEVDSLQSLYDDKCENFNEVNEELERLREVEIQNQEMKHLLEEKTEQLQDATSNASESQRKVEELNNTINSLENQLNEKTKEASDLSSQLSELSEKLIYLQSMDDIVTHKNDELQQAQDKIFNIENTVKDLESDKSKLMDKLSLLEIESQKNGVAIEELQAESEKYRNLYEEEQERYLDLQHSAVSMESERNELEMQVSEKVSEITKLQELLEKEKSEAKSSSDDLSQRSNDLEELNIKLGLKHEELEAITEKYQASVETIDKLKTHVNYFEELEGQYKELKSEFDEMKILYETNIQDLTTKLEDTDKHYEEKRISQEKEKQRIALEMSSIKSSNDELEMLLRNLHKDYNTLQSERNKLNEDIKILQDEMNTLQETNKCNGEKLEDLESKAKDYKIISEKNKYLEEEIEEMRSQNTNILSENQSLKTEKEELLLKIQHTSKIELEMKDLENELEQVRIELSKKNLLIEKMDSANVLDAKTDERSSNDEWKCKYEDLLTQYNSLKNAKVTEHHGSQINGDENGIDSVTKTTNTEELSAKVASLSRKVEILVREKKVYYEHIREQDLIIEQLKREKMRSLDLAKRMSEDVKKFRRPSGDASVKEWENRLRELGDEVYDLRDSERQLKKKVKQLEENLHNSTVDAHNAEVYARKHKKEMERLKAQLNEYGGPLKDQLEKLKEQLESEIKEKNTFHEYLEKAHGKWKSEKAAREELHAKYIETCKTKDEQYAKADEALKLAFGRYKFYKENFLEKSSSFDALKLKYDESLKKQNILTKRLISLDVSFKSSNLTESSPNNTNKLAPSLSGQQSVFRPVTRRPLQQVSTNSDKSPDASEDLVSLARDLLPSTSASVDKSSELDSLFASTKKRKSDDELSGSSRKMKFWE